MQSVMMDRRKVQELKRLSLTGRLCYLFLCIERYLTICYPDRDWTPVAKRCWQWTGSYWDEGCEIYAPVVPEYLLEYDSYEETSRNEFDVELSEEEYLTLTGLFSGITTGHETDEINQVLKLPVEFGNVCECSDFRDVDEATLEIVFRMQKFLSAHDISYPDIDRIRHLTADQKNGWGDFMDSEYLSTILNESVRDIC